MFSAGRPRWNGRYLDEQKAAVVRGFQRLMDQGDQQNERGSDTSRSIDLSIGIAQKKELLVRLHSVLLPLLDRQLVNLSELLDPLGLQGEPASKFQLILNAQADMEDIIDEVHSVQDTLFRVPPLGAFSIHNKNDQHLEELKPFRLRGLNSSLADVYVMFHGFYQECTQITQRLRVSAPPPHTYEPSSPSIALLYKQLLISCVSYTRVLINLTIKWIVESEFQIIHDLWLHEVETIDKVLLGFSLLTNPLYNKEHNHQPSHAIEQPLVHGRSKRVIRVVKSLIPVIKLSRLFFKKSSQSAVNGSRRPFFTEMDSNRLDLLSKAASRVRSSLEELLRRLKNFNLEDLDGDLMITEANTIRIRLEEALFHVMLYFVPLIPETQVFPDQNHYKSWFRVWFTQLNLAVQNFIDAAEVLRGDALLDIESLSDMSF